MTPLRLRGFSWLRGIDGRAVGATGVAFVVAALLEVDALNGPWYWKWPWRGDLGLARTAAIFLPALLLHGWATAAVRRPPTTTRVRGALAALAASCLLFQLAGVLADPRGLSLVRDIVTSAGATSYYTDALTIHDLQAWLTSFHRLDLHLHSATHPPGPVLYYLVWIRLLGPEAGALAGGLALGAIAAAGVPTIYRFAALWTSEVPTRLVAAAFYAMLPGLVLFFPEFDQVYPILAMLLALSWAGALSAAPELVRYRPGLGAAFFWLQWVVLVVIKTKMTFINP